MPENLNNPNFPGSAWSEMPATELSSISPEVFGFSSPLQLYEEIVDGSGFAEIFRAVKAEVDRSLGNRKCEDILEWVLTTPGYPTVKTCDGLIEKRAGMKFDSDPLVPKDRLPAVAIIYNEQGEWQHKSCRIKILGEAGQKHMVIYFTESRVGRNEGLMHCIGILEQADKRSCRRYNELRLEETSRISPSEPESLRTVLNVRKRTFIAQSGETLAEDCKAVN